MLFGIILLPPLQEDMDLDMTPFVLSLSVLVQCVLSMCTCGHTAQPIAQTCEPPVFIYMLSSCIGEETEKSLIGIFLLFQMPAGKRVLKSEAKV